MARTVYTTTDPVYPPAAMRCVFAGDKRDAQALVWAAALEGIPTLVTHDPSATRPTQAWHIAVPADMADSPRIWILSIRGGEVRECHGDATLKHDVTCVQLVPGVEVR